MSAILHLLSRSARQGDGLQQLLLHVAPGDALVLLEEAVVEALDGTTNVNLIGMDNLGVAVFVMQAELELRGLSGRKLATGVTPIDYEALVTLVVDFELNQTWS